MVVQTVKFIFFLVLMTLTACGPRSLDDFENEGKGIIRSIIQQLQKIHTREDLVEASGTLQKLFDKLTTLMISAEEFRHLHPELDQEDDEHHHYELSDQLRSELNRIYRIEGGRQLIEKYQEKALFRLDAFEKKLQRQSIKSL